MAADHGSTHAVLLRAENICKQYRDGDRTLDVLRGISLTVNRGEFISIIGRSGSGKSTLLHILGALDTPTSGSVTLEGQGALSQLGEGSLARIRGSRVGFIYQFHHLLPEFSALENVIMPGMILRRPVPEIMARAREILEGLGLGERLTHRPAKLSGGEQQRVALARALINDPDIVLADEPTGDLDQQTGQEVLEFILKYTAGAGKALVMVTHDPSIAAKANRTMRLEGGVLH